MRQLKFLHIRHLSFTQRPKISARYSHHLTLLFILSSFGERLFSLLEESANGEQAASKTTRCRTSARSRLAETWFCVARFAGESTKTSSVVTEWGSTPSDDPGRWEGIESDDKCSRATSAELTVGIVPEISLRLTVSMIQSRSLFPISGIRSMYRYVRIFKVKQYSPLGENWSFANGADRCASTVIMQWKFVWNTSPSNLICTDVHFIDNWYRYPFPDKICPAFVK